MRRALLPIVLFALGLIAVAPPLAFAGEWKSEPFVAESGAPVPLGAVGDIEFWAPNRGLLITQGNDAMPAGLYAYDGAGWRLYSTVCGGHEGRIAWAGPTEFWTVSDQRAGQSNGIGPKPEQLWNRSLCHFKDGRVVASYAEPIGVDGSYEPISAAACNGPDECWFGGERLPGTINTGAFHLRWDGSQLSAIPSLTESQELADPPRAIRDLAFHQGQLFESVQVSSADEVVAGETIEKPSFLHRIEPGAASPFVQLFPSPLSWGTKDGTNLLAFQFAPAGAALWAMSGANSAQARPTLLRGQGGDFVQVPLLNGEGSEPKAGEALGPGDRVLGIAAEPGGDLWVSFRHAGDSETALASIARVARVGVDGVVEEEAVLPAAGEGIARKGVAGPIACPQAGQCWMATGKLSTKMTEKNLPPAAAGWLFHRGEMVAPDTDPAWHTPVIESRPGDPGFPSPPPTGLPEDDSGGELPGETPAVEPEQPPRPRPKPRALVGKVKQRLIGRTLLRISFSLSAKAHVQLLARRHGRVVAKTPRRTLAKGRHSLRLRLDPERWPTGLDLRAKAMRSRTRESAAKRNPFVVPPITAEAVPPSPAVSPPPAGPPPRTGNVELPSGSLVGQPDIGAPSGTRLFAASPAEAAGEVWGAVAVGGLVRYTDAGGWEELDAGGAGTAPGLTVPLRATASGGVALLATGQRLFTRDPGGSFVAAPAPGASLGPGETLVATAVAAQQVVSHVAIDEPGGRTGAFVVPVASGNEGGKARVQNAVLYYDGTTWSREEICLDEASGVCTQRPADGSGFKVLGIDASGPEDAWLLAGTEIAAEKKIVKLALFERQSGQWHQRRLGGPLGDLFSKEIAEPVPGVMVGVEARTNPGTVEAAKKGQLLGQPLTVTAGGLWIDARLKAGAEAADATVYVDGGSGQALASWCDLPGSAGAMCTHRLGSDLPGGPGRSFAWPGGGSGDFGARTITGVGRGAILVLAPGSPSFARLPIAAAAGAAKGAALAGPEEGWLGTDAYPLRLTREPEPSRLEPWPVPFRRPLTALAPEPGVPVGALSSEALAVGDLGEVARYLPGQGWTPESLLTGSGARAKPRLRAVAWPEAGSAYAVGDGGAMWLWRQATGLWEPDPGKPPNLIRGNFTGIAFDPANPGTQRGYAVGKQGLLLSYGKGWTQDRLPAGVDPEANFTSIAFAGGEALATYRVPVGKGGKLHYAGGLLVNDGSGWRVDAGAAAALNDAVPLLVSGLPDGGAVLACSGPNPDFPDQGSRVIARGGLGAPWQASGELPKYPVALAAFREGAQVRALVSLDPFISGAKISSSDAATDSDQVFNQPPPGQAPLLTEPYGLPGEGFVMRQTASGWRDEQHQAFPAPAKVVANQSDMSVRPDPVFALMIDEAGDRGWAVGGETGLQAPLIQREDVQTAGVMRYGSDAAKPANATAAPIPAGSGVTLAIGGHGQCAGPCADLAGTGIGPDRWLPSAVMRAAEVPGVRAFIHTGPGLANLSAAQKQDLGAQSGFRAEVRRYAERLAAGAGQLPVYAAATQAERDASDSLRAFAAAFAGPTVSEAELLQGYYAFDSGGAGGTVRVIVLDYSKATLGEVQRDWLAAQLATAKAAEVPAIVVGNRDLGGRVATSPLQPLGPATDASLVVPILLNGGASAYFFDYPGQNRGYRLTAGGRSIPTFGSGTLGYEGSIAAPGETDFVGASGFLLASVHVDSRDPATNVAPVSVRLIPNIGELALDATDGTLLRRSSTALFDALARRPRGGWLCKGMANLCIERVAVDPYLAIPSPCKGAKCSSGLFPEYSFTSSNPDIADFVRTDPASTDPRRVLFDSNGKPIPDARSGLLCAYNAGTTTVTVAAGGFAYSTLVTVQKGSVQRPCGTVPLRNPPSPQPQLTPPPPPPAPAPTPTFTSGPSSLPPPPPPAPLAPAPVAKPPPPTPPPTPPLPSFVFPSPVLTPLVPIVPPPPPPAAQTTPPSGTSPVTQPVTSPQDEQEEEAALDLVHHAVAYRAPQRPAAALLATRRAAGPFALAVNGNRGSGGGAQRLLLPGVLLLLALGMGAAMDGMRRGRRGAGFAYEWSGLSR